MCNFAFHHCWLLNVALHQCTFSLSLWIRKGQRSWVITVATAMIVELEQMGFFWLACCPVRSCFELTSSQHSSKKQTCIYLAICFITVGISHTAKTIQTALSASAGLKTWPRYEAQATATHIYSQDEQSCASNQLNWLKLWGYLCSSNWKARGAWWWRPIAKGIGSAFS